MKLLPCTESKDAQNWRLNINIRIQSLHHPKAHRRQKRNRNERNESRESSACSITWIFERAR